MIIDMKTRGFTIPELIIVIAVMAILLVLGVVNLRSSQANGRDTERKMDIETIAGYLENHYKTGSSLSDKKGVYPPTVAMTADKLTSTLRNVDEKVFTSPGVANMADSFKTATNNNQTTTGVRPELTTPSLYVYQPLKADGTLCTLATDDCVKFNLYYRLETDGNIYKLTSKNQ
jgi:prepilin-type N-terminal cleavage/methylation domain-containing protein